MADGDYVNKNTCNTQPQTLTTGFVVLATAMKCSEVILISTGVFYVKSAADGGTPVEMYVPANTYFTVRGITNTTDVTVKGADTTELYARAQRFSSSTLAFG